MALVFSEWRKHVEALVIYTQVTPLGHSADSTGAPQRSSLGVSLGFFQIGYTALFGKKTSIS